MAEREFSPEDIQQAADQARHGGFGDFMFMDPGRHRGTSRRRRTSRRRTSSSRTTRRRTSSSSRHTSRKRTSRHLSGLSCCPWRNTARGRHQSKSCWKDGNMWVYKKRKKRC